MVPVGHSFEKTDDSKLTGEANGVEQKHCKNCECCPVSTRVVKAERLYRGKRLKG